MAVFFCCLHVLPLCVVAYILISYSYKVFGHVGWGHILMTPLLLKHLFKGPFFSTSHIRKYWGLGPQHMIFFGRGWCNSAHKKCYRIFVEICWKLISHCLASGREGVLCLPTMVFVEDNAGKGAKVWEKFSSLHQHLLYTVGPEQSFLIYELIIE